MADITILGGSLNSDVEVKEGRVIPAIDIKDADTTFIDALNGIEDDVIDIDAEPHNKDWTKQSWDLPKFMSPEFMSWLATTGMSLEDFKKLPVYLNVVKKGLIKE